ncbi:unnamed protein product [Mytilus coruscus]|uniref:Fibrinogen C-terminal domain-containing protein n=1 Tax=Mytilus coruscus TaxID=42192 RepID=A0A6J8CPA9_MYTCO|nr:unnamed protein product [Mytilus coruscus]
MFKRLLAAIILNSCLTESCGKSVSLTVNLKVAVVADFNTRKIKEYTYIKNNDFKPRDCSDLNKSQHKSGVYKISPDNGSSFDVYCDMDIDDGRWTVRNKKLHILTASGNFTLRVDISDFSGNKAYAKYKTFSIDGASNKFKLTISGYSGTAGNSMKILNGMPFVTKDKDLHQCAARLQGAWWVDNCTYSSLNGKYQGKDWHGISWFTFGKKPGTIKTSVMMIRRRM